MSWVRSTWHGSTPNYAVHQTALAEMRQLHNQQQSFIAPNAQCLEWVESCLSGYSMFI